MKEIKEISQYTLKYLDHYKDGTNIPNLPIDAIYSFVYRSLLKMCLNNYDLPQFKQIDIILYLLDFNELYAPAYFLTIYEILFTHLDFNNIITKNHTKNKQTCERLKELIELIIKKEGVIKDYVRLSTITRITGLKYCIENHCIKRIM